MQDQHQQSASQLSDEVLNTLINAVKDVLIHFISAAFDHIGRNGNPESKA